MRIALAVIGLTLVAEGAAAQAAPPAPPPHAIIALPDKVVFGPAPDILPAVGATTADTYVAEFTAAGLRDIELLARLDYFAGSSSAETRKVAGSFGAHSVVLRGRRL